MSRQGHDSGFPDQLYGWQIETDSSWSLYSQNGTRTITVSPTGAVSILNVPAADPHVVGQLYTSAGALKISAG